MRDEDDLLIEALKNLTGKGPFRLPDQCEYEQVTYHANPPVTQADLLYAETILGFPLPPFLKRIYTEVGNGGFGPGYGLAPLFAPTLFPDEEMIDALVHTTLRYRDEYWPPTLLFICNWGCFISTSIDCSTLEYPLVRSGQQSWHAGIEASSLQDWLRAWLNGTPLFFLHRDLPPLRLHPLKTKELPEQ